MIRSDIALHERPVSQWTRDEGVSHLQETFDRAAKAHPDLMEPYMILLADEADKAVQAAIMRAGLRETFAPRHPNPFKPLDESGAV